MTVFREVLSSSDMLGPVYELGRSAETSSDEKGKVGMTEEGARQTKRLSSVLWGENTVAKFSGTCFVF